MSIGKGEGGGGGRKRARAGAESPVNLGPCWPASSLLESVLPLTVVAHAEKDHAEHRGQQRCWQENGAQQRDRFH